MYSVKVGGIGIACNYCCGEAVEERFEKQGGVFGTVGSAQCKEQRGSIATPEGREMLSITDKLDIVTDYLHRYPGLIPFVVAS